ncbi:Glutathione transport system permease protein GsiC [compost metagenome]
MEYGLDKPLAVQYVFYLGRLLQGDLGVSYSQHLPVTRVLAEQGGATLELTIAALLLAWVLVLLLTVVTAGRGRLVGGIASLAETLSAALPHFWLGVVLLAVFAFGLRWFPPAGSDSFASLILPAFSLAIPLAGFIAQVTRESLELTLDQPFVLTARTRGLSDLAVRFRHALRHALLPGVSLSGWAIGALISGAVVCEVIFSRKGVGRQLYQAVQAQDLPLVIGISLVVAAGYVLANILVDLLYQWIDPRQQEAAA